jgi:glycosyltransferase involved in cell wall biosynthesis
VRVRLIEPFFGGSHRAWAEGWRDHSRHEIELLTLEPRAWRWRMRGAATTLAPALIEGARPDVIVVSDMIDLPTLLALTRRELADVPVVLYLHENQLTYPRRPGEALDQGLAWTTWANLLVADRVWCNSVFHRDDLLGALPAFLTAVPDHDHRDRLDAVAAKTRVQPVGVALDPWRGVVNPRRESPPLVLSNQRWHHDKDIGAVVRTLVRLADEGLEFRVAVVGDDDGGEAETINPLLDSLGPRIVARGHRSRPEYEALLGTADIVVSAARNEFFGIAVVEATAAGAVPVLPRHLAYPETMPSRYHEAVLYEPGRLGPALRRTIEQLDVRRRETAGLAEAMWRHDWSEVAPRYDRAVDELANAPRE